MKSWSGLIDYPFSAKLSFVKSQPTFPTTRTIWGSSKEGCAVTIRFRWFGRFLPLVLLLAPATASAAWSILQMKDGYFWDPGTANYFVPRGFAYQTFNPPVGASQSFDQLEYDLREFKKMHANSVRAEFVWNTVETAPGVFDWSKPDFLVAKAEELGLRLFVLIGFQYAPLWFPDDWKATNDANVVSVVLNYEHPLF